jgi:hypothetical protein
MTRQPTLLQYNLPIQDIISPSCPCTSQTTDAAYPSLSRSACGIDLGSLGGLTAREEPSVLLAIALEWDECNGLQRTFLPAICSTLSSALSR